MKWVEPTKEQLLEEWTTEYDLRHLWDALDSSLLDTGVYDISIQTGLFLEHWKECCDVETIDLSVHSLDRWHGTLEQIKEITSHMGKNPEALKQQMFSDDGELPYVLLQKRIDGSYKTLGGRTRLGVAELLGIEIKALVFDTRKVGEIIINKVKEHLPTQKHYLEPFSVDELFEMVSNDVPFNERFTQTEDNWYNYHMGEIVYDTIGRLLTRYGVCEHTRRKRTSVPPRMGDPAKTA